jgi:hypothetical protein
MKTIEVTLKPILESITLTQNKLNLSDEEMENMGALKEYVQSYHTPHGYEVIDILVNKPI